tara:strand:+ start:378 stop:3317 length:2940 start_codon:yes stop_codon:yes gene_type:complete
MTDFDLLDYVQPAQGLYVVLGIKGKEDVSQKVVATREEVDSWTKKFVAEQRNVFFAVAKFQSVDGGRKKDNVDKLKAFWLDIDCGESKAVANKKTGRPEGYVNQTEAMLALKKFCGVVGLPRPTIVNSGRGLHVYWVLEEEITRGEWEAVATRLRQVCLSQNFYVDPSVFEVARILRIPNTYNFKDTPPAKVQVVHVGERIPLEGIKELLGVEEISQLEAAVIRPKRKLTALGRAIAANMESSFTKIMMRAKHNTSCAQLLSCYKERETLTEPRWFDALSIAKFCSDKQEAIHRLSSGHPDYDPSAVERKIEHILGPHSCAVFERHNPGGCEGCPHKGEITGPISLGKQLIEATEEAKVADGKSESEVGEAEEDAGDKYYQTDIPDSDDPSKMIRIPKYPEPFKRGKNGGIYLEIEGEEPKLVYEHDFYVWKRMNDPDPDRGDVAMFRLHTPKDGIKTFAVSNAKITDPRELRREISKQGILAPEGQFKLILSFIISSVIGLQRRRKAEIMRSQFGWAENDSKFIVGTREITKDGVYHSPASSTTESMAGYFEPKGTREKWRKVFELYDRPGLEIQAFAALSGFGAPLLKFTGQKGAIINLIHPFAGTGKTTVLRMANSICGDPEMLLGTPEDTKVSKVIKLGLLNNIVNTVDEMTNMLPEAFSDYAYACSQGRGKDKAEASANKLRKNNITWRNITLTCANASFYQKLAILKSAPDGEMMRLLEFRVDYPGAEIISTAEGKHMFDHQLNENYGHAIEPFMRYVTGNLEEVKTLVKEVQARIDKDLNLTQRERNWSAIVAANLAGGILARRLGIAKLNMARIYKVVTPILLEMREETKAPVSQASSVIGEFVNSHPHNMLAVEDGVDKRTQKAKFPVAEPKGALLYRYEPDTRKMFVPVKNFRKHCVETQIDYKEVLRELTAKGLYLETVVKRLSKGMSITSPGVRSLVFDTSHADFIDMSKLIPEEDKDASGEDSLRD